MVIIVREEKIHEYSRKIMDHRFVSVTTNFYFEWYWCLIGYHNLEQR